MEKHQFTGSWITSKEFANLEPVDVFHRQLQPKEIVTQAPQNRHILFRKRFCAKKEKAIIYISADDCYKLYLNGRFVCQGPAPGYPSHYYYNTVDVTDYLTQGVNTLAVHTYYQGLINRVWVSGDDRHGLILDLEQNGKTVVSTDESFVWTYHTGFEQLDKFGYDTQFAQRYLSGGPQEGFEQPVYDDFLWTAACRRQYTDYTLYPQPSKMLTYETVQPELTYDENGITADFGGIYVGYLQMQAIGQPNDRLELLFGQELNGDGSVRWQVRANCNYREEWVLSGNKDTLNEFDYKSYRYVRINLPRGCTVTAISLLSRHYPFTLAAKPNTADPQLLRIWQLCADSLHYGAQEVIQDCMEREKGNYLGDGCYTALAHMVLTGDNSLLKKLFDDSFRSRFIDKGLMTCACCSLMQEIAEYPLMVYFTLYAYYQYSGDKAYLAEKYDQLQEILDYYRQQYANGDGLLVNLDKWCVVEWPKEYRDGYMANVDEGGVCTDLHSVINAHYIGALKYMNKIAKLLGKPAYCDETPVVQSFYRAFYDPEKKLFLDVPDNDHISMISNVFPLMYGIYTEQETEDAILQLINDRGFTTVMLFGAFPVLYGMKRIGRNDLVLKCLKDENAWLRMLREGATRTFEGWGRDCKWNTSLFHLTLSYGALFLTDWENFG